MNPELNSTTSVIDPAPIAPATNFRHSAGAPKNDTSRCLHRYANGRRCKLPGPKSGFCLRHFEGRIAANMRLFSAPSDFEDLSADLLPQPSEFNAALPIDQFLSRLLVLVTKGRVTPRRAAVMAYITNQLLRSHRAVQRENEIIEAPPQLDFSDWPGQERRHPERYHVDLGDLPRPDRSSPEDAGPARDDSSINQPLSTDTAKKLS